MYLLLKCSEVVMVFGMLLSLHSVICNDIARLLGQKNKVFVSDYITRKTGVGRLGKHFFLHFFLF